VTSLTPVHYAFISKRLNKLMLNLQTLSEGNCASGIQVLSQMLMRQPFGLFRSDAAELLKEWGPNALEEKKTPKWLLYLKMVRLFALLSQFPIPNYPLTI